MLYYIAQAFGILATLCCFAMPLFKRNRICNEREQVDMVIREAPYLDRRTILSKLPNITVDEAEAILEGGKQGES